MGRESMPSSEEMAKNLRERTLSDAELLERGAQYKVDEKGNARLEVTAEQVEQAKKEMNQEKEDKLEATRMDLEMQQLFALSTEEERLRKPGRLLEAVQLYERLGEKEKARPLFRLLAIYKERRTNEYVEETSDDEDDIGNFLGTLREWIEYAEKSEDQVVINRLEQRKRELIERYPKLVERL